MSEMAADDPLADAPAGAGEAEHPHPLLTFDLGGRPAAPTVLDEEREKHRLRAQKFGVEFKEPGKVRKDLMLESKRERNKHEGFATGFDVFSPEEQQKRTARAARFEIANPTVGEYKPDEEIAARTRRAEKWGVDYKPDDAVLMDMDLFEARTEAPREAERRAYAVHMYGVDVMSTNDVYAYFDEFAPTFVEWINDSSCNITFSDEYAAKRAMCGRGHPLPPTEGTAAAGLDPTDIANLPYLWHQGKDFVKDGTPVSLIYRMATVKDVRDPNAPRKTRELWKTGDGGGGGGRKARRRGGRGGGDGKHQSPGGAMAERMDDDGGDDEGGGGGDVDMRPARGPRGGRRERKRRNARGELQYVDDRMDTDDGGGGDNAGDLRRQLRGGGGGSSVDMGPPRSMVRSGVVASAAPVGTDGAAVGGGGATE